MEGLKWLYDTILKPAGLYVTKKNKIITTEQREHRHRAWSDLPPELLSLIAERAGLLELLSFYRVCNPWRCASSTALAHIVEHELNKGPWFLLYEDKNSECQLLTTSGKKFTVSLPELDGTTCLATYNAWLLLFKQGGSMFFFHIFSRRRIDLPKFPFSDLTDHVASVSSSPTSQDCVVCVISRSSDEALDVKALLLGDRVWLSLKVNHARVQTDTIKCGVYHSGIFIFFDDVHDNLNMPTIFIENRSICYMCEQIEFVANEEIDQKQPKSKGIYRFENCYLKPKFQDMKNKLGLTENVSISTCGTTVRSNGANSLIFNESVSDDDDESKNRRFKGVWIQPALSQNSFKDDEA
uniref:F-box/kelch-repeat protein At1g57790-like n=1 Tax=Fragaria vesca subsp. vesca TaxID=101020 RepID=UPI0005C81052|nr:PREDICTED: F-box/kelch-repeat protein At1g57790-like [Fragaria vesca subsp. vesca]